MKPVYDGLKVERIPVTSSDIFTSSIECISNVMNVKVADVCISEHVYESFCSEYEHSRDNEDFTPGETSRTEIC